MTKEKLKSAFMKCLPLLIVLASTAVFIVAIKLVMGIFYKTKDSVYVKEYGEERFTVVHCLQKPVSNYYLYGGGYSFDEDKFKSTGSAHDKAHIADKPLSVFTLREAPIDMEKATVKTLLSSSGLKAYQLDEFVIYQLEGAYGVLAPLRSYKEASTNRKNDLYVVRQLLKDERWKAFDLPDWESGEEFLGQLEKIEWYLDAEYGEDN